MVWVESEKSEVRKQLRCSCPTLEQIERRGQMKHIASIWHTVNHTYLLGGEMTPKFVVENSGDGCVFFFFFTKIEDQIKGRVAKT